MSNTRILSMTEEERKITSKLYGNFMGYVEIKHPNIDLESFLWTLLQKVIFQLSFQFDWKREDVIKSTEGVWESIERIEREDNLGGVKTH